MTRWSLVSGVLLATVSLTACGGPPPPPPTEVNVTLTTSADSNASADGKGNPLVLRLYQLQSAAGFESADFFPLFNDDAGTLKTDLVKRDEFLLPPGQTKKVALAPLDTVKAIGVFGAFRIGPTSVSRVDAPVEPHKITNIIVTAGRTGLVIKTEVVAPKSGS